jgi:CheY-like chemotaxis protein
MAVVLIIEDDADVADTVNACLESSGHTCHVVATGEQGLDGCKQLEPDVIILDLTLPGMNGIEVCTHIRRFAPAARSLHSDADGTRGTDG